MAWVAHYDGVDLCGHKQMLLVGLLLGTEVSARVLPLTLHVHLNLDSLPQCHTSNLKSTYRSYMFQDSYEHDPTQHRICPPAFVT